MKKTNETDRRDAHGDELRLVTTTLRRLDTDDLRRARGGDEAETNHPTHSSCSCGGPVA